jgi:hypothetical protein
MKHRSTRTVVSICVVFALVVGLVGSAIAAKPRSHGSKGHAKSGLKSGVNKVKGGTTTLTVDPAYATEAANAGITIAPVTPATNPATGTYVFPITGGRLVFHKTKKAGSKSKSKKQLSGFVKHSGGISLTKGATTATLSDLRVNLSANKTGRVDVTLGTGSLKLAKLSNVTINSTNKQISATVTLTTEAINAVNAAYGTTFSGSVVLGTVVIAPTF